MFIAFLAASTLLGLFMSYIWSSNGAANTFIKMVWSGYTIWAVILLFSVLQPIISAGGMKLF